MKATAANSPTLCRRSARTASRPWMGKRDGKPSNCSAPFTNRTALAAQFHSVSRDAKALRSGARKTHRAGGFALRPGGGSILGRAYGVTAVRVFDQLLVRKI